MKKLIILILLSLACAFSVQAKDRNGRLQAVINSFKKEEGFDLVSIGTPVLKLLVTAWDKNARTPEDRASADLFRDVKKFVIADYSDCSAEVKAAFRDRLDEILADEEPIMEAQEKGSVVKIYGELSEDGTRIYNVVLREDGDGSLIYISGSVSVSNVTDLSAGAPV